MEMLNDLEEIITCLLQIFFQTRPLEISRIIIKKSPGKTSFLKVKGPNNCRRQWAFAMCHCGLG